MMQKIMEGLAHPFAPAQIIWKPGATTRDKSKCMALAYADLRAYQERLDEVCGLGWSVEYEPWGDMRVVARVTINGVTRSSTGEMTKSDIDNGNGGTVAEAQAFKRACAMFGMGRYLYNLPSPWVEMDGKRISKGGIQTLDQRYRVWHDRTVAQKSQPEEPASQPDPSPAPRSNGIPKRGEIKQIGRSVSELLDQYPPQEPDPSEDGWGEGWDSVADYAAARSWGSTFIGSKFDNEIHFNAAWGKVFGEFEASDPENAAQFLKAWRDYVVNHAFDSDGGLKGVAVSGSDNTDFYIEYEEDYRGPPISVWDSGVVNGKVVAP